MGRNTGQHNKAAEENTAQTQPSYYIRFEGCYSTFDRDLLIGWRGRSGAECKKKLGQPFNSYWAYHWKMLVLSLWSLLSCKTKLSQMKMLPWSQLTNVSKLSWWDGGEGGRGIGGGGGWKGCVGHGPIMKGRVVTSIDGFTHKPKLFTTAEHFFP